MLATRRLLLRTLCLVAVWLWAAALHALDGMLAVVTADTANVLVSGQAVATIPRGTRIWLFAAKAGVAQVLVPGKTTYGQIRGSDIRLIQPTKQQFQAIDQVDAEVKRLAELGLKERAATEREMERALRLYREVYGEDHPEYASCLAAHGKLYYAWGDDEGTLRCADGALPILRRYLGTQHAETIDVLVSRGHALVELDRIPEGLADLREVVTLRKASLPANHLLIAAALQSVGESAAKADLFPEALRTMQEALAIARRNPAEGKFLARTLLEIGQLQTSLGDFLAARTALEESVRVYEKTIGPEALDMIYPLGALGILFGNISDHRRALAMFERELAIKEKHLPTSDVKLAKTLHNIGLCYGNLKDHEKEKSYYEQSHEIYLNFYGPDDARVANSYASLGTNARDRGDFTTARKYLLRALALYEQRYGPDYLAAANLYHNLGMYAREQGDEAEAERLYRRSLAIKKKYLADSHPDVTITMIQIALTKTFLALREKSDPLPAVEQWNSTRRLVTRHIHSALPALSDAEQLRYLSRFHADLNAALSIGLLWRDQQPIVRQSAEWLLNGKSIIQQVLADQAIVQRDARDSATAPEFQAWQAAREKLAKAALGSGQNLAELEQQEQELARKFASSAGRANTDGEWVTLAAVQANLPARSRLIEIRGMYHYKFNEEQHNFTTGKPGYYAWIIPPANEGPVTIVELGDAASLEDNILAARKAIAALDAIQREGEVSAAANVQAALHKLSQQLWQPLAKSLVDVDRLIISPDNELWLAPWAALPYDDKLLLERYVISFAVSGRDLVKQSKRVKETTAPLLFADPDFNLSAEGLKKATQAVLKDVSFKTSPQGPLTRSSTLPLVARLPYTAEEAKVAASTLQAEGTSPLSYTDRYALESIAKRSRSPRTLLFSTHGYFLADLESKAGNQTGPQASENPLLRCGLLLAGCNQAQSPDSDDGILTGLEIVGMDLRGTELVVLSACETGIGKVRNGEGVAGLRQAFQLAGAQSVVSTLWQVPDRDSAIIMQDFFTNLAAGQSKADALRNAQLKRIEARKEKSGAAHPFFWAAWTVTGE